MAARLYTPLIQIHRVFEATCADSRLLVHPVDGGWELEVKEQASGRTLFTAERCSERAAKAAAADFASNCGKSPTQHLDWQLRW